MELRQLRTFEAVARHRTVNAAAAATGLAPSSVSATIRALEDSLGVPLFERTPRGMTLTTPGETLLGWSARLLDQAEQARRDVTAQAHPLRLGALESLAAAFVPGVLARLAERRPDLRVQVRPAVQRTDLLADLAAGRLEAALLLDTGPALGDLGFAAPPQPLDFLDLAEVGLALVAAPGHPWTGGRCTCMTSTGTTCWSTSRPAPSTWPPTACSAPEPAGCTPAACR